MTQRERPAEAEFTRAPDRVVDAELVVSDAIEVTASTPLPVDMTFPDQVTVAVDGAPAAGGKLPVDVGSPTVAISGAPAADGKLPVNVGTPTVSVSGTATVAISGAAAADGKLPVDVGGAEVSEGRLSVDSRPHFFATANTPAAPAATSHVAGDIVVGKLTFSDVTLNRIPSRLSGVLASFVLHDYANSPTKFAGFCYLTLVGTDTYTDDAAFSVPEASFYGTLGIVTWTAADWVQHSEGAFVYKPVNIPYSSDGDNKIYGVLVTTETKTFAASNMRVLLRGYKD